MSRSKANTKFIGIQPKWPGKCNKRGENIKEITPANRAIEQLKQAIKELAWEGEDQHEGPLVDLSAILSKIVQTYEQKDILFTLEKYAPELIKAQ